MLAAGLLLFRQTRARGLYISAGLLLDLVVVNGLLKNLIARARPYDVMTDWLPLIAKPHDYSFPSGHTAASFVAAFLCRKLLPKRYSLPIMVLAVLIAFSRLYLGVHYPSDVLGGALLGYVLAMTTLWLGRRAERKLSSAKEQIS
ncbi:MAG: phosphatase PAP2 family protein [Wujia sp.]|nr:phosphatase PAP2 family protein [Wujia sp.]MDY3727614.1 phosphatase PAP2 family protein [Wujia sp.]